MDEDFWDVKNQLNSLSGLEFIGGPNGRPTNKWTDGPTEKRNYEGTMRIPRDLSRFFFFLHKSSMKFSNFLFKAIGHFVRRCSLYRGNGRTGGVLIWRYDNKIRLDGQSKTSHLNAL